MAKLKALAVGPEGLLVISQEHPYLLWKPHRALRAFEPRTQAPERQPHSLSKNRAFSILAKRPTEGIFLRVCRIQNAREVSAGKA